MSWFRELLSALPAIKTKFQLTGLIVGLATLVAIRVSAPDAVVAQISAGAIGILFLIFGQIFQAIPHFPIKQRATLIITLFIIFVLFILVLVTIILFNVRENKHHLKVVKAELELATLEEINKPENLDFQRAMLGQCKKVELVRESENKFVGIASFEYGSKRGVWVTVDAESFYWELAASGQEGWFEMLVKQLMEATP